MKTDIFEEVKIIEMPNEVFELIMEEFLIEDDYFQSLSEYLDFEMQLMQDYAWYGQGW